MTLRKGEGIEGASALRRGKDANLRSASRVAAARDQWSMRFSKSRTWSIAASFAMP